MVFNHEGPCMPFVKGDQGHRSSSHQKVGENEGEFTLATIH
jgi:hypothetical protein